MKFNKLTINYMIVSNKRNQSKDNWTTKYVGSTWSWTS